MAKRTDIKKILVVGAGPIIIGQACEFDYSGTQACKALREEGYTIILVNSNPATIMTDPTIADRTYIEPLSVPVLEKIIRAERPDAILPTVGGQTGLNLSMDLHREGVLKKYNVEMIGARPETIQKAEGRNDFKLAMERIGLASARSEVAYTLEEAIQKANQIGYPLVVRPAFTLGGTGGGHVENEAELIEIVGKGLRNSLISEVLIEESIVGWKEYELEVMRDKKDNVVIVCSIENIDPMGVHTGDSITVAPAQTLTDREYQFLRDSSIAIMREIGVDTGGSNVQFAVNPKDGRVVVIEMNPRVSRSSALASKATGFPIAKFAAKLAVGYTLDELFNDITKKTTACFEPALDYCVIKIPRFDIRKFSKTPVNLGTSMKSVGEAMAIGRTFKEAFQKGIRSLEVQRFGFGFDGKDIHSLPKDKLKEELTKTSPERLFHVLDALRQGFSIEEIHEFTGIDPWFLNQFKGILELGNAVDVQDPIQLRKAKRSGFSDVQLATISGLTEGDIRDLRKANRITPTYGLVDTCAGEFEAYTPYYYSSYETTDERQPSTKEKIMIIGGGPNRIGQGIEFDYCCVHASFAIREAGYESIMVNSNPETVSTDFDISDKLFFEPLTFEDVVNIYEAEKPLGVILQFGGQTPLNLSIKLAAAGIKILGTQAQQIDRSEDREKSKALLKKLGLRQPINGTATSRDEAEKIAQSIGFPVVARPSYVIGGTSMRVLYDMEGLSDYMDQTAGISKELPLLLDKFLEHAIEVDIDCISDGNCSVIVGMMEHIEPAGIHSGDSACVFPPHTLSEAIQTELAKSAKALAKELAVIGLLNIQFAIKDDEIYVIEVNPRASRTVPFISKASGVPWIKHATQLILGKTIQDLGLTEVTPNYFSVKESVFPFNRFDETDLVLGPEMKSTGEVMGIDPTFEMAFLKAQWAAGTRLDNGRNHLFVTVADRDKPNILKGIRSLVGLGYTVSATRGTAEFLQGHGINASVVYRIADGQHPNSLDVIQDVYTGLVLNTSSSFECLDEKAMRRCTLSYNVPFISTTQAFEQVARSLVVRSHMEYDVCAIQDFYNDLNQTSVTDPIKLFIRQSFTESTPDQSKVIQGVLGVIQQFNRTKKKSFSRPLVLLSGDRAYHKDNFKGEFEKKTGMVFTPQNFRSHRLALLNEADAFIIIRTALSESSVFEITYNIYQGRKVPIFFAVHKDAKIKTTLIRDLEDLVTIEYQEFDDPEELRAPLEAFLKAVERQAIPVEV